MTMHTCSQRCNYCCTCYVPQYVCALQNAMGISYAIGAQRRLNFPLKTTQINSFLNNFRTGESGVNRSPLSKVPLMCDIYVLFIPKTTPKVIHLPYMVLSAAIIRKGCRSCTILGQRGLFQYRSLYTITFRFKPPGCLSQPDNLQLSLFCSCRSCNPSNITIPKMVQLNRAYSPLMQNSACKKTSAICPWYCNLFSITLTVIQCLTQQQSLSEFPVGPIRTSITSQFLGLQ